MELIIFASLVIGFAALAWVCGVLCADECAESWCECCADRDRCEEDGCCLEERGGDLGW